jgi:serine/threonine protein kinase
MSLIGNKYKLLEKIGEGAFGSIYKGENVRTKELVAVKVEPIKKNTKLLKNESIIYQYLINNDGLPNVKWFGKDKTNYYMVLNLLGESLQSLKERKKIFSLKLVLQIGIQIINLLRMIHNKGLVHRDIKPDNFLLGLNNKSRQINIIDFGFCKTFLNDNKHIDIKKTNNVIGTNNFASTNAHEFNELSRRDDLESLGYMLIYFYLGNLPWKDYSNNEMIKIMKNNIMNDESIPKVILKYFEIIKSLEFKEAPNYELLINIFKNELKEEVEEQIK